MYPQSSVSDSVSVLDGARASPRMEAKVHEDDPLVLTYHASQVHGEDIALLHPGRWLNDRIIAFVGEYVLQCRWLSRFLRTCCGMH